MLCVMCVVCCAFYCDCLNLLSVAKFQRSIQYSCNHIRCCQLRKNATSHQEALHPCPRQVYAKLGSTEHLGEAVEAVHPVNPGVVSLQDSLLHCTLVFLGHATILQLNFEQTETESGSNSRCGRPLWPSMERRTWDLQTFKGVTYLALSFIQSQKEPWMLSVVWSNVLGLFPQSGSEQDTACWSLLHGKTISLFSICLRDIQARRVQRKATATRMVFFVYWVDSKHQRTTNAPLFPVQESR